MSTPEEIESDARAEAPRRQGGEPHREPREAYASSQRHVTEDLNLAVQAFVELEARAPFLTPGERFHTVLFAMHRLCVQILRCEQAAVSEEEILTVLKPAREIHGRSAFIGRLQLWPRGYPGDSATIDRLMAGIQSARLETVEQGCEWYALNCAAAQQDRNKLDWQARLVTKVVHQI
jgi:hypothetical protein